MYIRAHKAGNPAVPLDKFIENPHYMACPTLLEAYRFHWRGLDIETLREWRAVTFRLLKQIQDEEGRRAAGGQPE